MRLAAISIVSFLSLISLQGCGSNGPALSEVQGKISVDGKPLQGALVTFIPTGGGSPSYGGTDESGSYRLMFTDTKYGAMIGEHEVQIETTKISAAERAEMKAAGEKVNDVFVPIPKKYKKKGALTAKVEKSKNVINFELQND